jgi:hypothetical protein
MGSSGAANRDAGLRRISRTTRWLAGGAVALMGTLAAVAAYATPGKAVPPRAVPSTSATTAPSEPNASTAPVPSTRPQDGGLQPPAQPPVRTHRQPSVASGGT